MSVDAERAIRWLESVTLQHRSACLYYVWKAYAYGGASTGLSARTALEAWGKTKGRHPGDRNPPRGAAVWWGAKKGSSAGDVVISLGGGRVLATDYPRYGVVGECTIAQREQQIGRPYLGWSDHIFDAPIALASVAGEVTPGITQEEGFLMALTQYDQELIRNAVVDINNRTDSMQKVIAGLVKAVWDRRVDRGLDAEGQPILIPAIQELADAKTLLMALVARDGVDVDESKLASALAPLLTSNLGALSDADVKRIATAAADEQAKRLAS